MKRIITFTLIALLLVSCDFMADRYKVVPDPEVYFPDGQELKMATAIYEDKPRAIRSLIEEGIDLNHISKGGMTYLYYAMLNKNYDVMELLLKHGADPNIHSEFYTNPAYHKIGYGDDNGACLSYCGRRAYDIKYMKLLVKYGANVNDTTYISPLALSIDDELQGKEKVAFLVQHGANINLRVAGATVISSEANMYNWDKVLILLDLGADPMAGDDPKFNVAASVQQYYDEGFDPNSENGKMAQEVKRRLEQRGVKFPYLPKKPAASTPSEGQPKE